ncbi:MAG: hypothetical protein MI866_21335, partial [Bacteroidales bacterium]|nr:hypothetical protein [Bacteroidales bacterium]
MKQKLLILSLLFLPLLTYGQRGYYSTDSTTYSGIKLKDGGSISNAKYCKVDKDDKITVYSPYEVSEYGFNNGRVFIAKEIQTPDSTQKVFLERLHKGKVTLYYYKGRGFHSYYIEKDSTLFIEVPRRNSHNEHYSQQLLKILSDCPIIDDACSHVTYSPHSMTRLLERYDNCELKPFPHFRYGFLIGYEFMKLIPLDSQNEYLEYFNFSYDGSFSIV